MNPLGKGGFSGGNMGSRVLTVIVFLFSISISSMPEAAFAISQPAISASAADIFFGRLRVGDSSASEAVTITNLGKSDLVISDMAIRGIDASEFSQTNGCVNPLPQNGYCTVSVTFTPSLPFEKKSARIVITSNDPLHPTIKVLLHGRAASPEIRITPLGIDFPPARVSILPLPEIIAIRNWGQSDLVITGVELQGINASEFKQTNDCLNPLPMQNYCTVTIIAYPSMLPVRHEANLVITSNDPVNPVVKIPLSARYKDHGIFQFLGVESYYNTTGSLMVDNGFLYWAENSENAINKIALSDNTPTTVAKKIGVPTSIALHGQHLYWLDIQDGTRRLIKKTSLNDLSTEILAEGSTHYGGSIDLIVDDAHVYWVEGVLTYPPTQLIKRVSLSGGNATTMVTTQGAISAITADSNYIYWQEEDRNGKGNIWKISKDGGEPLALLSDSDSFLFSYGQASLSVSGSDLFFTDKYRILKVPVSGGVLSTLATADAGLIDRLVVDGTRVYWTEGNSFKSVSVNGDDLTLLADGLSSPSQLTMNGDNLCWWEVTGRHPVFTPMFFGMISCYSKALNAINVVAQDLKIPGFLVGDNNHIYWTEGSAFSDGWQRIARVSLADGAVSTFITGVYTELQLPEFTTEPVTVAGDYIYVGDGYAIKKFSVMGESGDIIAWTYCKIADIVTDGDYLYWIDRTGFLYKMSVNGGDITEFSNTPKGSPRGLLIKNGYLYWHDYDAINKVSVEGGASVALVTGLPPLSITFIVDDKNLYFNDPHYGGLKKKSIDGGKAITIGDGGDLAIDDEFLYVFNYRGYYGALSKMRKNGSIVSTAFTPYGGYGLIVDKSSLYWLGEYPGIWTKTPK
ncbi:MAG: choice-of-anchor D domain-containing protein [Nitrospirae bacterium]|nr:choice-of-anchor D domain-containing protein [Nitrospirota bacterium]